MLLRLVPALALLGLCAAGAQAGDLEYQVLDPNAYQSFVGDWTPPGQAFCAALQNTSQWNEVMHPAPTMGSDRAFGPPASFWATHSVVLVARAIPGGDARAAFKVNSVRQTKRGLEVAYAFTRPPKAGSTMKWYLAVAIEGPLPDKVRVIENRHEVCKLTPGTWSPLMVPTG